MHRLNQIVQTVHSSLISTAWNSYIWKFLHLVGSQQHAGAVNCTVRQFCNFPLVLSSSFPEPVDDSLCLHERRRYDRRSLLSVKVFSKFALIYSSNAKQTYLLRRRLDVSCAKPTTTQQHIRLTCKISFQSEYVGTTLSKFSKTGAHITLSKIRNIGNRKVTC